MSSVFDELTIVKRSGQRVSFNGSKIAVAIKSAFDDVYTENMEDKVNIIYGKVLDRIECLYSDRKTINVEDIQDIIENILKEEKYLNVYNAFNDYRIKRAASREVFEKKQQHKFVKATEKLVLTAKDDNKSTKREMLNNFGKTISSEYSLAYLIDSKYTRMYQEGIIYIHDLDYYVLGIPRYVCLDLTNIEDYDNYFDILTDISIGTKKEVLKEVLIPSFDYLLEPYMIYKFKKIFEENLYNFLELEGFIDYINIKSIVKEINKLSTIFINYNDFDSYLNERTRKIFDYAYNLSILKLKNMLKNDIKRYLSILNNDLESSYCISIGTCYSKEGKLITDLYFECINELDTLISVSTIYKGNDLDFISKLICLRKNICVSFNTSYNKLFNNNDNYKYEVEYFSDGLRIAENILDRCATSVGRMNIYKTTINLARLSLKSKDLSSFYSNLDNTLELVRNELIQRFEYISSRYKENYDYLFKYNILMDSSKLEDKKVRKVYKNGTLEIGYSGLYEALLNLDCSDKLEEVLKYLNDKCNSYSNEFKLNFVLSETSDYEVLKYFNAIDKSIYGVNLEYRNLSSYIDDLKTISNIEFYSNGGFNYVVKVRKNATYKYISEILKSAADKNLGFIRIKYEN